MVVLSLGTNLGDRFQNMKLLEREVEKILHGAIRKSPLYETEPIGVDPTHPTYLNRIVAGEFRGSPQTLLLETQKIESMLGRVGKGELLPRTADVDILLFEELVINSENLIIPHHALFERHFEIAGVKATVPEMKIPQTDIHFGEYQIREQIYKQKIHVVDS